MGSLFIFSQLCRLHCMLFSPSILPTRDNNTNFSPMICYGGSRLLLRVSPFPCRMGFHTFSSHRGCPVFILLLSILCPLPSFADCGRSSTVLLLLVMLGPCQCFWCHQSPHQVFGAIIISVSASCLSLLCCFFNISPSWSVSPFPSTH